MSSEESTNRILRALNRGEITEAQARDQLIELRVHPDHAEEMIAIEQGEGDVQEV